MLYLYLGDLSESIMKFLALEMDLKDGKFQALHVHYLNNPMK
jgi:hypothetical protein